MKEKLVDCNEKAMEMFRGRRNEIINASPFIFYPEKQLDGSDHFKRYELMQDALA